MRKAIVKYNDTLAGILTETTEGTYIFQYDEAYCVHFPDQFLTFQMPVRTNPYYSVSMFPFFDGLIPEGWLLTIVTESWKLNQKDRMGLLLACCQNSIGAVSVHPLISNDNE
ncbi:HipA N-terminal domain-containing protein [Sphingobacterium composti Ten et al. 2007 non Yoo et al. 2007]|uniref:HipA N-terminal domain-containing protein n=1 Tax=Sphingobacterium composti TaxID=363260 RepID=UPI001358E5EB|nr:HipA N-terminal domain-containing protein [Sphingobacterium composti Ten et al. 2007 non Yoo et al. 2007]